MELYEFIFLILGVISLFDYIKYSFFRYKYKDIISITGEPENIKIKRMIEFVIVIITISIFVYKFLF